VPASAYQNTTIYFTIKGTNFPTGSDMTQVNFTQQGYFERNVTINSITATSINGTLEINKTAPSGKWNLSVTTTDGSISNTLLKTFTVNPRPAPIISSFTPGTGFKNTTVSITLNGNNFQTEDGNTNISLVNQYTGEVLYGAITTATSSKILGTFTVPANVAGGTFDLIVTTADGGSTTKAGAFTLNYLPLPTISAINQTSGYRNTTVNFMITGNNFQPGVGGTYVRINSTAGAPIFASLSSVTSTKIIGTFTIPFNEGTGKYRLDVLTTSGGSASKQAAFTVNPLPAPTITAITPVSGFRNTTVAYTITGNNFQPNGGTGVNLSIPAFGELNTTVYSVTPTQIIGTVQIPSTASYGAWKLNVTTVEGRLTSKPSAFTVKLLPVPTITSFTPATGYRGTTVTFVINGNNFEPGGRTFVNLTKVNQTNVQTTLTSVFSSQITGTVTLPGGNTNGTWKVNVTTLDGGVGTKLNAINVL